MKKPSNQEIMEAYLVDLQKDIATAEKLKQEVEALRTENWSLEKRNGELKKNISEIENREKRLKEKEEEISTRQSEIDEKTRSFRLEKDDLYTKQIKFTGDIENYEKVKVDIDKRVKNITDREKAIEAKEYEIDIEKGKLEQKLRVYRDKLKI